MINMQKKLDELHLKTKMVLQVHDELIFDVPKVELDTIKKNCARSYAVSCNTRCSTDS